jgi:5'-3' exonuclease
MRVHLVDGTYELFRAHFAPRPDHAAADGQPVKATVGVMQSLIGLLGEKSEQTTHLAVAFDNPIESWRNRLFDGYKTSAGIDPPLWAQFDLVEEAVRALGIVVWSMKEWEADDALATGAARWAGAPGVEQVRLCTPDKDLLQCVRGDRVVQVDRMRQKVTGEAAMREVRGFAPASMPDFLALVGDDADGIPGLPGFGAKGAARLLGEFGHLEQIPDAPAGWPKGLRGADRLAATLRELRPQALLYRRLATLVTDVPLAEDLAALEWRGFDDARLEAMCARLASDTVLVRARTERKRRREAGLAA